MPRAWKASASCSQAWAVSGNRHEPSEGSPDASTTRSPRKRLPSWEPWSHTGVWKRKSGPSADRAAEVDTTFMVEAGSSRTCSWCAYSGRPVAASTTKAPVREPSPSTPAKSASATEARVGVEGRAERGRQAGSTRAASRIVANGKRRMGGTVRPGSPAVQERTHGGPDDGPLLGPGWPAHYPGAP